MPSVLFPGLGRWERDPRCIWRPLSARRSRSWRRASTQAASISAARYTTLAVTTEGHVYSCTEHWHSDWAPRAERVTELSQVARAVASE